MGWQWPEKEKRGFNSAAAPLTPVFVQSFHSDCEELHENSPEVGKMQECLERLGFP